MHMMTTQQIFNIAVLIVMAVVVFKNSAKYITYARNNGMNKKYNRKLIADGSCWVNDPTFIFTKMNNFILEHKKMGEQDGTFVVDPRYVSPVSLALALHKIEQSGVKISKQIMTPAATKFSFTWI